MAQGRACDGDENGDDFESQVISAFGEAFNNVALHAYPDPPVGEVEIAVDWNAEALTIGVTDTGESFDPETVSPPELDALPEGGMGLFIMRSFMDEIAYRPGPPNVLHMSKRLGGSGDERRPESFPPFSTDSSETSVDEDCEVQSRAGVRTDWPMDDVVEGVADRAPSMWGDGAPTHEAVGYAPPPRIAARVVGGSRRT
jgi:Histidine kinase-like ATPase domain